MRCYFHLVNCHETILDDTGIEVSDLEVAKAEARKAIAESAEARKAIANCARKTMKPVRTGADGVSTLCVLKETFSTP
jgi:hypothetical protein